MKMNLLKLVILFSTLASTLLDAAVTPNDIAKPPRPPPPPPKRKPPPPPPHGPPPPPPPHGPPRPPPHGPPRPPPPSLESTSTQQNTRPLLKPPPPPPPPRNNLTSNGDPEETGTPSPGQSGTPEITRNEESRSGEEFASLSEPTTDSSTSKDKRLIWKKDKMDAMAAVCECFNTFTDSKERKTCLENIPETQKAIRDDTIRHFLELKKRKTFPDSTLPKEKKRIEKFKHIFDKCSQTDENASMKCLREQIQFRRSETDTPATDSYAELRRKIEIIHKFYCTSPVISKSSTEADNNTPLTAENVALVNEPPAVTVTTVEPVLEVKDPAESEITSSQPHADESELAENEENPIKASNMTGTLNNLEETGITEDHSVDQTETDDTNTENQITNPSLNPFFNESNGSGVDLTKTISNPGNPEVECSALDHDSEIENPKGNVSNPELDHSGSGFITSEDLTDNGTPKDSDSNKTGTPETGEKKTLSDPTKGGTPNDPIKIKTGTDDLDTENSEGSNNNESRSSPNVETSIFLGVPAIISYCVIILLSVAGVFHYMNSRRPEEL